ncbi:MAG: hypothetical protein JWN38_384 [Candidatus Saccharibacteria bacterium]|nr:hypothetical protein [Candidatus Saccharibacteria bacterium]
MYSGSTFTSLSGHLLGAHQKIDRVAHRHLTRLAPGCSFPSLKSILHFEGNNGPDAIKRKSPAKDEPWHYFQPFDLSDTQLIELIEDHYKLLVTALRKADSVRAAFEASWLAHAIVDGLTPAHHYPFEEKLQELRGGLGKETRTNLKNKLVIPGDSAPQMVSNNWKMWGPKGLFTTHGTFEWGIATIIKPLRFMHALPTNADLQVVQSSSIGEWYRHTAQMIAQQELYDDFSLNGWTARLSRKIRQELAPTLVRSVTLVWYAAAREAGQTQARSS